MSNAVTERLLRESKRGGILNIDVLSFQRLAHRIFDTAGGDDREIIDDTGKSLILRRVLSSCEGELKALRKSILKPGYVTELKSVISEFVQYEVSPDDILKAASKQERAYARDKYKDIALIYKVFREVIGERYVTREELLDKASDAAERAEFLKGAEIFIDDFTGFTPIQYRFLEALFPFVDGVSLCLDYDGEDGDLFALSVSTIAKIRSIADGAGYEIENHFFYDNKDNRHKGKEDLMLLNKRLFRKKAMGLKAPIESRSEKDDGDSRVRIIKCATPERESFFIIHEIMRLVREEGYRYRDMAIVLGAPDIYANLLLSEAERQEVPLFLDFNSELILNPYTEFIRSAMEAARDDLRYDSVFDLIRTNLTGIDREDADRLENYVRALNIKGKRRYGKEFRFRTKRIADEELLNLNSSREKLLLLLDPLLKISRRKKTAEDFTDALNDFLESSLVKKRMEIKALEAENAKKTREASLLRQAVKKTDELLFKIKDLLQGEKMAFSDYIEVLVSGLESIKLGTLPPGRDSVRAGDTKRSRYNDVKILFFAGVNEGILPATGSGAGLLSDFDREFLGECDVSLSPNANERIEIDKLYFYMNACSPSEKLYLAFSQGNNEGKSLKPSFFLHEINRILPNVKTESFREEDQLKNLYTGMDGLSLLSAYLDDEKKDPVSAEVYSALSRDKEMKDPAKGLVESRFSIKGEDKITEAVSKALYGYEGKYSPTRLERFAECALRHFLSNGLRLEEREEFSFERRDLGSVLHGALNSYGEIMESRGLILPRLGDEMAEALAAEALSKYLKENESLVLNDNERNKYFINRISRILRASVKILRDQSSKGSFLPRFFESPFNLGPYYGRIDRIDMAEAGDKLYASVIDYKSGNKAFDPGRIYYGLDLQLLVYLSGALKKIMAKYPGKEVIPAGIFYFHIDDPVINEGDLITGTDEELKALRLNASKLRGIVSDDETAIRLFDKSFGKKSEIIPVEYKMDGGFSAHSSVVSKDDLSLLSKHVLKLCDDFIDRIEKGETKASPILYDGNSPCDYCEYESCCACIYGVGGKKVRRLKKIGGIGEIIKEIKNGIYVRTEKSNTKQG